jgi:hypothetical protein
MPESLTITLPESVMGRLRDHAAERNESISDLAAEAIRKMLEENGDVVALAKRRLIESMRNSPGRGLRAGITWTRDELYER